MSLFSLLHTPGARRGRVRKRCMAAAARSRGTCAILFPRRNAAASRRRNRAQGWLNCPAGARWSGGEKSRLSAEKVERRAFNAKANSLELWIKPIATPPPATQTTSCSTSSSRPRSWRAGRPTPVLICMCNYVLGGTRSLKPSWADFVSGTDRVFPPSVFAECSNPGNNRLETVCKT